MLITPASVWSGTGRETQYPPWIIHICILSWVKQQIAPGPIWCNHVDHDDALLRPFRFFSLFLPCHSTITRPLCVCVCLDRGQLRREIQHPALDARRTSFSGKLYISMRCSAIFCLFWLMNSHCAEICKFYLLVSPRWMLYKLLLGFPTAIWMRILR